MKKRVSNKDKFTREYEKIMGKSNNTEIATIEWNEKGDIFKKFSMYGNYTPVKTSGNTTLISR